MLQVLPFVVLLALLVAFEALLCENSLITVSYYEFRLYMLNVCLL
jgi:hypothetical protein